MSKKNIKHKQKQRTNTELPNQEILDLISTPNAWTPKSEDAWLDELKKITAVEIYRRFPPMKKPGNVSKRGKSYGG